MHGDIRYVLHEDVVVAYLVEKGVSCTSELFVNHDLLYLQWRCMLQERSKNLPRCSLSIACGYFFNLIII